MVVTTITDIMGTGTFIQKNKFLVRQDIHQIEINVLNRKTNFSILVVIIMVIITMATTKHIAALVTQEGIRAIQ